MEHLECFKCLLHLANGPLQLSASRCPPQPPVACSRAQPAACRSTPHTACSRAQPVATRSPPPAAARSLQPRAARHPKQPAAVRSLQPRATCRCYALPCLHAATLPCALAALPCACLVLHHSALHLPAYLPAF
ncbi:unnamed protein product [Closterium sp. NIES-54]